MIPTSAAAVVVGAGPAGLAAAHALTAGGVAPVLVLERDEAPGGLPRHCGHLGFGWEYAHRLESGPRFVARLLGALDPARVRVLTRATALALRPGPTVEVVGAGQGAATIEAGVVVVATGTRERPRAARLVPGGRPEHGVVTTGQLQQMVARGVPVGGRRAVVVGTEHVAFSALLTARHAGLRVVAMIESQDPVMSYAGFGILARGAGIPIHLATRIDAILGGDRPEGVAIEGPGGPRVIPCDTVVFTGDFVPDAPLLRASGVELDTRTGGPIVDQYARTTMAGLFATGNVLRAVESSGFAACEGAHAGACAAAYLGGRLRWDGSAFPIALDSGILYLVPQRWDGRASGQASALPLLPPSVRVAADFVRARLCLRHGERVVWQSRLTRLLRQRRIHLDLASLARHDGDGAAISLGVQPAGVS
jgi:thioredoxin reductase